VLAPATLALLGTHFSEGSERTRAVNLYAATAGIGASLGLVLGGLFADWLSWRMGFFINLPVGIALAWSARRHLRESERHAGEFDVASALSSTFGMGALVFGLVRAAEFGWQDRFAIIGLLAGPVLLALLVWNESRAAHPILPLRLFASGQRARAYAARVLFLGGMGGFWFFTTQLLQGVLGLRPRWRARLPADDGAEFSSPRSPRRGWRAVSATSPCCWRGVAIASWEPPGCRRPTRTAATSPTSPCRCC
jgi:MFS family permease